MTARSNLFGLPPGQAARAVAATEKRIREFSLPGPAATWPAPVGLRPTLSGYLPGIVGRDPWVLQCDGCGATETLRTIATATFLFNHDQKHDTRRLCPTCQGRAGWEAE